MGLPLAVHTNGGIGVDGGFNFRVAHSAETAVLYTRVEVCDSIGRIHSGTHFECDVTITVESEESRGVGQSTPADRGLDLAFFGVDVGALLRGKADVALQEGGEKRFEVRSAGTAGCQGSRCGGDWCGSGDRNRRESNSCLLYTSPSPRD